MTNSGGKIEVFAWLSQRSVAWKIALGFTIVLVLHLSIVALGHYGLIKAEHDRATQEALRAQVETFYWIDHTVSELQRNVLLYAFSGYRGPETRVAELHQQLERILDAIEAAGEQEATPDNHELVKRMRRHLQTHRDIFAAVVTDREKRRDLLDGALVQHNADFTEALERIGHGADGSKTLPWVSSEFTLAYLNVMRFVKSPDSSLVRDVRRHLGAVRTLLESAREDDGLDTTSLVGAVDGFERAFIQMTQSTRGYLHLVNVVLAGESVEFNRLAKDARRDCSLRADRISAEIEADSRAFRSVNNAFSVLTVLLAMVASWLIARDVAPPLNAITETFDGLAKGEACESIPGLNRGDELGRLAHAAEVFRAKAAETQRLLDEVTRMKELERQTSQSRKMEAIGQLAAGIAHEINTPMQAVAGNVAFLSDASGYLLDVVQKVGSAAEEPNAGEPEWRERLKELLGNSKYTASRKQIPGAIEDTAEAARRVIEIVRAMKTLAHPGQIELESLDLNQIVRDTVTVSRNRWKEHANVEFELDEGIPNPEAHASAISQVVLNLVVNAADAIGEHREELGELGTIWVRSYADSESVYVEVQDTGGGIPEAIRSRVFEPFFTTKDVGKGTGQGLAFCYDAVVKRHKGSLELDSVEGVGATFTVRLPIAASEVSVAGAESNDAEPVMFI